MAKPEFLKRHGVVRSAIKKDILFFGIPALTVFILGLIFSGSDGYDGLLRAIWELIKDPHKLFLISIWNIAGLVLFVVGLTIAFVAVFTLRRSYYSTLMIMEDHQLITHGIYRFTRHPIYLGVLIGIMGVPVYAPSLYGFLTMLLLIPISLNRIRMEEKLLTEEYGNAYRTYSEATSKLIPFIY
jgi:protein-S-isoprenylcysteine O-methyltransferase